MSDNKTGKKTGARNRRKRRLRRQFMVSSVAAVTVFLLALVCIVTGGIGRGEAAFKEIETTVMPSQTELPTQKPTQEKPTETESIYIDVTPPVGTAKESVTWWDEEELKPEEFVESMQDDTEITVSFQTMPDMTLFEEEQEVSVCLTDEGGNQTVLTSKLILMHDEEAPKMSGVYNMTVFAGDTILYRKNVKVTDNHDENPKLTIDSSQVNRDKVGTYHVTYRAEDKAGNVTEETIFVKVMEKVAATQEMVDQLADKVLAEILSDGMSNRDKAYAIYSWTKKNIAYTGHTDPSDIVAGAYQGLRYRAGDCFTFCAVAHMLYNRAGFQAMKVTRTAGYLHHYWNYVNFGEGWYHCDSNLYRADGFEAFMKTTEELITYTTNAMNRPDYYVYDESQYPPCAGSTGTESESQGAEGQQPGEEGALEEGQLPEGVPEQPVVGAPEEGQPSEAGVPEGAQPEVGVPEGAQPEAGVPEGQQAGVDGTLESGQAENGQPSMNVPETGALPGMEGTPTGQPGIDGAPEGAQTSNATENNPQ